MLHFLLHSFYVQRNFTTPHMWVSNSLHSKTPGHSICLIHWHITQPNGHRLLLLLDQSLAMKLFKLSLCLLARLNTSTPCVNCMFNNKQKTGMYRGYYRTFHVVCLDITQDRPPSQKVTMHLRTWRSSITLSVLKGDLKTSGLKEVLLQK